MVYLIFRYMFRKCFSDLDDRSSIINININLLQSVVKKVIQ